MMNDELESDSLQPLNLPLPMSKRRTHWHRKYLRRIEKEVRTIELWRSVVSECLAMFFFIFLSLLATLSWTSKTDSPRGIYDSADVLRVALSFGLSITVLTHCFGHISGAHFNPSVTFAMVVTGKATVVRGLLYLFAQCGGSIAGAALLFGITPSHHRAQMGVLHLHKSLSATQGLGIELLLTFLVVFTYFATQDKSRQVAQSVQPFLIGCSVILVHIIGLPLTGCGVNPARALGPAFISNKWKHHWIYWAGPLLGAFLAGLLYEYIFTPQQKPKQDIESDTSSTTSSKETIIDSSEKVYKPHASLSYGFTPVSMGTSPKPTLLKIKSRAGLENLIFDANSISRTSTSSRPYRNKHHFHHSTSNRYELPQPPFGLQDEIDEYGYSKSKF